MQPPRRHHVNLTPPQRRQHPRTSRRVNRRPQPQLPAVPVSEHDNVPKAPEVLPLQFRHFLAVIFHKGEVCPVPRNGAQWAASPVVDRAVQCGFGKTVVAVIENGHLFEVGFQTFLAPCRGRFADDSISAGLVASEGVGGGSGDDGRGGIVAVDFVADVFGGCGEVIICGAGGVGMDFCGFRPFVDVFLIFAFLHGGHCFLIVAISIGNLS
mmetsp:Transcript_24982/g.52301  ORF Transcript_24982/g.52301 Transcript_24982/m.52301 type:complete len:211 (+) Transcript_24982:345-977(+)